MAFVSVVLPVYNERDNLRPLTDELLDHLGGGDGFDFEIVFVDDGSTDGSRSVLAELETDSPVRVVYLRRNFGQSAALSAGIDYARGDYIVTMDADGQNAPADIPDLLATLREGYDCVSGWRVNRQGPIRKRLPSAIQTRLAKWTGPDINDFGCTLTAYRASALADINIYGEGHRYIPAKLHKLGYDITEQPVSHRERGHGTSKYGLARLVRGFVDLLFHMVWNRYSSRPLHLLGGAGLIAILLGLGIGAYSVAAWWLFEVSLLPRLPRLLLTMGLVFGGVQLVMFGFLAELLTKLYYRDEQEYRVERLAGFDTTDDPIEAAAQDD